MGKRGPKPQFTDVACPNTLCEFYGLKGKDNVVGNGTSMSRGEKVGKYICRHCCKVFNDHTGTFYYAINHYRDGMRRHRKLIKSILYESFGLEKPDYLKVDIKN